MTSAVDEHGTGFRGTNASRRERHEAVLGVRKGFWRRDVSSPRSAQTDEGRAEHSVPWDDDTQTKAFVHNSVMELYIRMFTIFGA